MDRFTTALHQARSNPFPNSKVQQVVYHGTGAKFDRFAFKHSTQGIFWFTSDKTKLEKGEIYTSGKGVIMPLYVNIERPADWQAYDKLGLGELQRDYDGVLLQDGLGGFEGFVFHPNQIRKAQP